MMSTTVSIQAEDTQSKRDWIEKFHANGNDKKVRVGILISDKIEFKTKDKQKTKKSIV